MEQNFEIIDKASFKDLLEELEFLNSSILPKVREENKNKKIIIDSAESIIKLTNSIARIEENQAKLVELLSSSSHTTNDTSSIMSKIVNQAFGAFGAGFLIGYILKSLV